MKNLKLKIFSTALLLIISAQFVNNLTIIHAQSRILMEKHLNDNDEDISAENCYAYLDSVVTAESAIMIDAKTGVVLYEKNADEVLFPASTTKIMTALLLLEHVKALYPDESYDDVFRPRVINFSHHAVYSIEPGSSNIGMYEGDVLSVEEALYAILLPSANEVAAAVGEYVSGTEEAFAQLMTERAAELGCKNTSFKNAHGLTDLQHYTSARDLSLILREAIKHPEFTNAISTRNYTIPPTAKQPLERTFHNTNKLIQPGEFYFENVIGGKTGYTDEARHTLVACGEKSGIKLITAVMKADKNFTYHDTTALMNYGFSSFARFSLSSPFTTEIPVTIDEKTAAWLPVETHDSAIIFLPKWVAPEEISYRLDGTDDLTAFGGYNYGEKIDGPTLSLTYRDATLSVLPLYAAETLQPAAAPPLKSASATHNDAAEEITPVFAASVSVEQTARAPRLIFAAIAAIIVSAALCAAVIAKIVLGKHRGSRRYKFRKDMFK